ncbi:MAG: thiamine pyrophosphate-binding protein [Hyphomicrobiaceae bacterium]|nr:thiamine pyrophosphate-binding protein [Hyphomicrobiaceae bacterium]
MAQKLRGADIVARSLDRLGHRTVFTLSGNHIMSIFDAAIEAKLELIHTRHEAAAVHMADAWGRLTGEPGIAMVTGGPGHANAVGALFTALSAESPMVLLSGHAATWELGRGGFQEIRQADMAAPVSKASWTAKSASSIGEELGEALRVAKSGRPGPVHLSLPSDLLDETVEDNAIRWPEVEKVKSPGQVRLPDGAADAVLAIIAAAKRPVILAGPHLSSRKGRQMLSRLEQATGAPAAVIESPRGANDATLGAFGDVVKQADLVVLLGKALDFTIKWANEPTFAPGVKVVSIDPDGALVARAAAEKGPSLAFGCVADTYPAGEALLARSAASGRKPDLAWLRDARSLMDGRPETWASLKGKSPGRLHAAEVFRALRPVVERDPETLLICDGGEFAQWGQSLLPVNKRLINSVAGSIGGSLPFAIAGRVHQKKAPVIAVLGDGTFGFHMSEFETAVRHKTPFVAILGNDACWNAESQIQRRDYGAERMHGCELLPARYDQVVSALGGHGELVERIEDLAPAVERALASGKPACVNVQVESIAAPIIRRS